jgi:hypothetical protein
LWSHADPPLIQALRLEQVLWHLADGPISI